MGPTIAIATAGAAAIAGGVWLFNKIKNDKPQVIADGVKKIVSDYFYVGLKNEKSNFPPQFNTYVDSWQNLIDTRLKNIVGQITKWTQQMEEKEKTLIAQVSSEKNIKESNINFLNNTLKGLNEIRIDDF